MTDVDSNRVRVVAVRSGRFYGEQIAGAIYTVAGDGVAGAIR